MPKSKLNEHAKKLSRKPISILEMINGRVAVQDVCMEKLAEAMGVKRTTAYARLHQPIEEWSFGQVLGACKYLNIPPEDLRERITY